MKKYLSFRDLVMKSFGEDKRDSMDPEEVRQLLVWHNKPTARNDKKK
jgi:hypothetical protein